MYCRIEKAEKNDNKCWYVLMLVFSVIFYVGSLAAIILLYVFFTEVWFVHYTVITMFMLFSYYIAEQLHPQQVFYQFNSDPECCDLNCGHTTLGSERQEALLYLCSQ